MSETPAPTRISTVSLMPTSPGNPVEWRIAPGLVSYEEALKTMEERAEAIARGEAQELVWLIEHPPLYTAGTSAQPEDLIQPRFPVHEAGRGGQYTYHGPGQRIAYVMLDLRRRKQDVRAFVCALEAWLIETLDAFNVRGERRDDRVGVWVARPDKPRGLDGSMAEDKIAAMERAGIKVSPSPAALGETLLEVLKNA